MLTYGTAHDIATQVFTDLNIPDDIYLTWDKNDVQNFEQEYINEGFIRPLVEAELKNYDTSENSPTDIEDIIDEASDEVSYSLTALVDQYWDYQNQITLGVYHEIVDTLKNAPIANISDIDVLYEPADLDYGVFNEERAISIKLSNGATITLNVEIEND